VTCMGGEVLLFHLSHGINIEDTTGSMALELVQRFKDHAKHVTSGRFAPLAEGSSKSSHFVTVSRDHKALVYGRDPKGNEFTMVQSLSFPAEVTCCSWVSPTTFILAVREDHRLHYWDVNADGVVERLKVNLNASGDAVVSFAVLALAVSADGSLVAACTDKSRVILLQAFSNLQLRNLYGITVDEYDMPSVCFSLDRSFLYVTSSMLVKAARKVEEAVPTVPGAAPLVGEVAVFEVRTGELVLKLSCHEKAVRCMDRHPFAEVLITGSFDRTVKYWS